MSTPAIRALEDGSIFKGISIGAEGLSVGEVVFNTSMTGYQEILTDPSYSNQMVTLTYPHIGKYGTKDEDEESDCIQANGLINRELPLIALHLRQPKQLDDHIFESQMYREQNQDMFRQLLDSTKANTDSIGQLTAATAGLVEVYAAGQGVIKAGSALGRFVKWLSGIAVVGVGFKWIWDHLGGPPFTG